MALRTDAFGRWSETKRGTANAAVTVTSDVPGDGRFSRLHKVTVSIDAAASTNDVLVEIKDGTGGTVIWQERFDAKRGQALELNFGDNPRNWLLSSENKGFEVVCAAPGAGAIATVNFKGDLGD